MRIVVIIPNRFENRGQLKSFVYLNYNDSIFDETVIVARMKDMKGIRYFRCNKINDKFYLYPLPYYVGIKEFLIKLPIILSVLIYLVLFNFRNSCFLIRGTDISGILVSVMLKFRNLSYGFQVIGDPELVYTEQNLNVKLARYLRKFFTIGQKYLAKNAKSIAYVTKQHLQRKYPPSLKAKVYSFSGVYLPDNFYVDHPRRFDKKRDAYKLLFVGSLEQKYKGLHILLRALKICIKSGLKIKLIVLGDGKYSNEYKNLADYLRISDYVEFKGFIWERNILIRYLDESDLFVLPSLTEGLPSALIEAMARAVPCIATNVGGIPELLDIDYLVEPNNEGALANLIIKCLLNPYILNEMSQKSLSKSIEYRLENMNRKKNYFLKALKEACKN